MSVQERGRRYTLTANINDLKSKFREASRILKDHNKDLRALNNSLKFDTNNIDTMYAKWHKLNSLLEVSKQQVANIKQQMSVAKKLGLTQELEKLKVELAKAESNVNKFSKEFKELDYTVVRSGFFKKMEKLSSDIEEARANASKLDKALKLDPKNITLISTKLGEMRQEFTALSQKSELLSNKLKYMDPKLHPEKVRAFRVELEKTKAETKSLVDNMKVLAVQRLTGLNNSFEQLDKSIEKSSSNVKELNSVLKSVGNKKIIQDTQFREFNNVLEKTKDKVRIIKHDLSKLDPNIDIDEFVRLNKELNKAEANARELVHQMGALNRFRAGGLAGLTGTIGNANRSLATLGRSMQDAGRNYTLGFTLPVAYGTKRLLEEFRETDDGIRRVAAAGAGEISGGFKAAFEEVSRAARNISTDSVYSIKEVSDGMEQLVKAGWNVKDSTEQVAHVMNLAKVEGMELGRASEIVTDGISAFGLAAKDTQRFVDVLTQTSIDSTTDITKLGETFKYVSPIAGQLGFSIEDVGIAIGLMANKSIKASTAGTSLRGGLANLVKPSKQARAALDSIGFSMTDTAGNTKSLSQIINELRQKTEHMTGAQKTAFATAVFGKTAMAGWTAILNSTDSEVRKLTDSINNSSGATQRMADNINGGIGGAIDKFKTKVSNASASVGKTFEPAVTSVLGGLGKFADAIGNSSDNTKLLTGSIIGLTAVIPPLLFGIGGFVRLLPIMGTGLTTLKAGFAALLSPTGLMVAGIAAAGIAIGSLVVAIKESSPIFKDYQKALENNAEAGKRMDKLNVELGKSMTRLQGITSKAGNALQEIYPHNSKLAYSLGEVTSKINDLSAEMLDMNLSFEKFNSSQLEYMSGLNGEMNKLLEERNAIYETQSKGLISKAQALNSATALTNEEYLTQKTSLVKGAKSLYDTMVQEAQSWYIQELSLNEKRVGAEKKTNKEIEEEYDRKLKKAEEHQKAVIDVINKGEQDKIPIREEVINNLKKYNDSIAQENENHQRKIEELQEKYKNNDKMLHKTVEEEKMRHKGAIEQHRADLQNVYAGINEDELAMWVTSIATNIENGATLTGNQKEFVQNFLATMDNLPEDTKNKFIEAFTKAGVSIDDLKGSLQEKGSSAIQAVVDGMDAMKNHPYNKVKEMMEQSKSAIDNTDTLGAGSSSIDKLAQGMLNKKGNVTNNIDNIMKESKSKVDNTPFQQSGNKNMNDLQSGINSKSGDVSNAAQNVATNAKNSAGSVDFSPIGAGMGSGMASGIWSKASEVLNAAWSIAERAYNYIKDKLGINSPSRLFKKGIGYSIPEGMAVGISEKSNLVKTEMLTMARGVYKTAKDASRSLNIGEVLSSNIDYSFGSNVAVEHSTNQSNHVIDTLNQVVNKLNNLELKSNVYLDSQKVGEITYKEHLEIDRRFAY